MKPHIEQAEISAEKLLEAMNPEERLDFVDGIGCEFGLITEDLQSKNRRLRQ